MSREVFDSVVLSKTTLYELKFNKEVSELGLSQSSKVKDSRSEIGLNNKFHKVVAPTEYIVNLYNMVSLNSDETPSIVIEGHGEIPCDINVLRLLKAIGQASLSQSLQFAEVCSDAFMTIVMDVLQNKRPVIHVSKDEYSLYQKILFNSLMDFYVAECG